MNRRLVEQASSLFGPVFDVRRWMFDVRCSVFSGRFMQLSLFLLIFACLRVRADVPPDWSTNYDATLALARTNQLPSLVYFTASWCGPCKLMTRLTLVNPVLTDELTNVVHVAVDIDAHPNLAGQYGIDAVPTFVLLSATGDEADRTTGFQPIGDFLPWLTNGVSKAKEAMARHALSNQTLAEVDQMLASTEPGLAHNAASKLFDLCNMREDAIVQAAAARLKVLAARDPAAVLEGLNDPRLASRIQAANALRETIGDKFDIDPWSEASTRAKAIGAWREKLK